MELEEVSAWVAENFKLGDVRRTRALALMAWGLIRADTVSYAAIGRNMESSSTPASQITRVYKFCHNKALDPVDVQEGLVQQLVGSAEFFVCGQKLVTVALDWHAYDNGRVNGLRLSLMTGSRALPLLWYEIATSDLLGRQGLLERHAIRELIRLRPPGVTWLILLDAGFKSPDLIQLLDEAGYYIVRTVGSTLFHSKSGCWTAIRDLPVPLGCVVEFGWGYYTRQNVLRIRLVGARLFDASPPRRGWRKPKRSHWRKRPGRCLVATNLPAGDFPALVVIRLYTRRFEIEHSFRDIKNATYGMDMDHTHLQAAETYARLMCIVAIAEAILWLAGAEAEDRSLHQMFTPSQPRHPRRVLSLRRVGLLALKLITATLPELIRRHIPDAIAGVMNVVGRSWISPWKTLRLKLALTERALLTPFDRKCRKGRKQRKRVCRTIKQPDLVPAIASGDLFYSARRAA